MRSPLRRVVTVLLTAFVLVVPFTLSAQADDPAPVPTTTRIFVDTPSGSSTTTLTARVSSAAGVPTGTVTFFKIGVAAPLAGPVPVDALGDVSVQVPTVLTNPFYRAEFTGTGGYGDSAANSNVPPETLVLTPEPTIATVGGPGLLKLNLTMSAHAYYTDGSPAVGQTILFTLLGIPPGPSVGGPPVYPEVANPIVVCVAQVDHDGLASCKGKGSLGAIVSILTLGGFASYARVFTYDYIRLPVILAG